jgi:uncharacterized membrane protein
LSGPADARGSQPGGSRESVPRPRIQTLSDLIFGLALSIGALSLNSTKPTDITGVANSLVGFGFTFMVLALVWVRYSRIMSVLPAESGRIVAPNMLLLFLVSVEPYLFSLMTGSSFVPVLGQLDLGVTTTLYAVDMGSLFLILAYFSHELASEERKLIPKELLRSYKLLRNSTVVTAALFLVSILPVFWSYSVSHLPVRFIIWIVVFTVSPVRREIERRRAHASHEQPKQPS